MKQPLKLKIIDIIGLNLCVSSEDGGKVYYKLRSAWDTGRKIYLDFEGVEMVISAFLNAAIGRLVKHYPVNEIRDRISFLNLNDEDMELIDRVLSNAETYYADPERFRREIEAEEDAEDEK